MSGQISFDDLRDVLWLAQKLPTPPRTVRRNARRQAASATDRTVPRAALGVPAAIPLSGTLERVSGGITRRVPVDTAVTEQRLSAVYAGTTSGGGIAARRIRLPAPHPMPDALDIARALQAVTRRRALGPAVILDEDATAEAIAHSELVTPVLRQRRERWFTLLLAVDDAPSMLSWRSRIDAFEQVLRRAGFRDLRRVGLNGSGEGPVVLRTGSGSPLSPQAGNLGADVAGAASTLLLVVSDTSGAAWHDGRVSTLLTPWTRLLPVAVVQPLPPALWPHTAVGFAELQVAAAVPGQVTDALHERRPDWASGETGLVLPVLALQAPDVASWARMVMATGNAWCKAALLPPADEQPTEPTGSLTIAATGETLPRRVSAFRAVSTPEALELAAAFAVIRPLNLPVMRLIQAVMLPQAGNDALAQVLMSGLLRRVADDTPAGGSSINLRDDDIVYEMHDTVRDELAGHLTRSRWLEVNLAVQRFVEVETGVGFDFMALIEDRLGMDQVAPGALPFAHLAARLARRFVPSRAGARQQRFIDEEVLGKGMTVQAQREMTSSVRRIEWAPSGEQLAVLHRWGVDVLARNRLDRRRRVRHEADVLAWMVWPPDEVLLGPLMEHTCDAFEALSARPLNNRVERYEPAMRRPRKVKIIDRADFPSWGNDPRSSREPRTIRLAALTPGWPGGRDVEDDWVSRDLGFPIPTLVPMTRDPGPAWRIRFDSLLRRWPGVLERPVTSSETRNAIGGLWKLLSQRLKVPPPLADGLIDTVGWLDSDGKDCLVTVRQAWQTGFDGWQMFVDELPSDPLPVPQDGRVAEFAPLTRALRLRNASRGRRYGAERFAPDGRCLARLDLEGELSLSPAETESPA